MKCPYCFARKNACEHLLVKIDTTFREAKNGALYEWFSDAWAAILTREGEDCDEANEFDDLLDTVNGHADAEADGVFEGGPGQSSNLRSFYCETKQRVDAAVEKLTR